MLVAFTVVVLGGMGSVPGALLGGLFIGVVESLCGLYFGESLGQLGIFLIFILVLLVRPTGCSEHAHEAGRDSVLAPRPDRGVGWPSCRCAAATASNTVLNAMVLALIIALAGQGWNILGGYGGQFSFGHAAFFGTGAYARAAAGRASESTPGRPLPRRWLGAAGRLR